MNVQVMIGRPHTTQPPSLLFRSHTDPTSHDNPNSVHAQDLTLWVQSTSMRVALFLPAVGWRVHHVLISPSTIATISSACASSILFLVWEPLVEPLMGGLLGTLELDGGLAGLNSTSTELWGCVFIAFLQSIQTETEGGSIARAGRRTMA